MPVPEGWTRGVLGTECTIAIGGTPSRGVDEYWDTDGATENAWVSIKDMHSRVIASTAERISDLGVKKSNVKLQPKGTVLLSFKLTIGRVAFAGVPIYTNEAIAGLKPRSLDPDYLYHGLQQWNLLQGVDQAIKGATLNKAKLKKISFVYPVCRAEQSKIAEVLSTVDRAIAQTEALIAKQQRIKAGLMQDLLTRGIDEHGNLRSEATHAFKDSPLGRNPVEWKLSSIGSMAEFVTSGARGWARYYRREGAIFLRIGNFTRQHINLRLDDLVHVQPPPSSEGVRTQVQTGDLLISVTADLGIIGLIPDNFGVAYVNQHIALARLSGAKVSSRFVGWFLSGHEGRAQFDQLNESGAKAGLNLPTVRSLQFPCPSLEEQKRIVAILDSSVESWEQHSCTLRKLRSLKTGLMQDLLTGKVRVTPLLQQAEAATA